MEQGRRSTDLTKPGCVALDVTRSVWSNWNGALPTGIDRVCISYIARYRSVARAVVQHRGIRRILTQRHSLQLFDLLLDTDGLFRRRIAAFTPGALMASVPAADCDGALYLNVGHTDMDVAGLAAWVNRCNLRAVYMIHDLIPLTHPEYCTPHAHVRHRGRVHAVLQSASGIIANSHSTAKAIRHYASHKGLRVPPVHSAWLGGAELRPGMIDQEKPESYFVCLGTIEGRKNHLTLLRAWRRLISARGRASPHLVIIGKAGYQSDSVLSMIRECPDLASHVRFLPTCSDIELADWIAGARAVLFPSFAEGFGLPLVESMQLGTPVIASNLPCFREVGEGIPLLLDPNDDLAWQAAIEAFLGPCADRNRQLAALKTYRAPTWDEHFEQLEPWLAALAELPRVQIAS